MRPHPRNPRKISDEKLKQLEKSLREFGDLSGVIFNRTTGNTVGGHQRMKILPDSVTVETKFKTPTTKGTVAEGFIEFEGERYKYREVEWGEEKEKAAMIAANQHGGEWDYPELATMLVELDSINLDMDLVGFENKELEDISV